MNKCSLCLSELFDDIEIDENEQDEAKVHNDLLQKLQENQKTLLLNLQTTGNKCGAGGTDAEGYQTIALSRCKGNHLYHKECLHNQLGNAKGDFIKCAVCETTYGIRVGEMPDGVLSWKLTTEACQGYESYQTIEFLYRFPNGIRDGTSFTGTSRAAFLPASSEGVVVFKMLVEGFRRRLSFLVGTSLTTGRKNTVVWAGLHHKTSLWGGEFGYPDPGYLARVTDELKMRDLEPETVKDHKINIHQGQITLSGNQI